MSHLSCDSVLKYPASSLRNACKQTHGVGFEPTDPGGPPVFKTGALIQTLPSVLIVVLPSSNLQQTLYHSAITTVSYTVKLLFHTHTLSVGVRLRMNLYICYPWFISS